MRILLTNDDGVLSPVLHRTAAALAREHDVAIAAPALDQSGKSHSFTHGEGRLLTYGLDASLPWPLYRVDGTPSDCVKFAVSHLLKDNPPDLVLSGPNLGENAGVSAVYSGTVAAAREGALWGLPSLAVSLSETSDAHLRFALDWLLALLRDPSLLPARGALWNINFPGCAPEAVAGARFTPMSTVMFRDRYEETATEHALPGYQLLGHKPAEDFTTGSDDEMLARGYITVAPLQVSQTDHAALARLKTLEGNLDAVTSLSASGSVSAYPISDFVP
ncbi:MAG: Multifunctional protein surE [Fibrobacteria bacterium]|nr:Multifunctional protein surE [Fibrobacteria bacterium]